MLVVARSESAGINQANIQEGKWIIMGWSKLFKIIWTKDELLCDYCKKHEARWGREQVIKGECYQYHLCQYHKNMRMKRELREAQHGK